MADQNVEVVIRRPGRPEHRVVLGTGVAHVGRAEDNDLVLTDIGVSRRHARILVQPGSVWIEDLGSGNGTYFKGQRITRHSLSHGDEVLVDPFTLAFEIGLFELPSTGGLTSELEEVGDEDTARVPGGLNTGPIPRTRPEKPFGARLVTISGSRLAPSYSVLGQSLTIGRSDARDIILFDPSASRNHAVIEPVGDSFWLRDEGSGNGTFVNSSRVKEQSLRHGDRVRVGSTEFRFEILQSSSVVVSTEPSAEVGDRRAADARLSQAVGAPGQPVRTPPSPGVRIVALAAVGGLAVVGMMFIGGLIALYFIEPELNQRAVQRIQSSQELRRVEPSAVTPEPAAPESDEADNQGADQFRNLFDKGQKHFDGAEYLKAASQYYSALQMVPESVDALSVPYEEAQRMARVSTEYLLFATLHKGLVLRNLPEGEHRLRRTRAVRVGKNALRGRGDSTEAVRLLREVLVFFPEDRQVQALVSELSGE